MLSKLSNYFHNCLVYLLYTFLIKCQNKFPIHQNGLKSSLYIGITAILLLNTKPKFVSVRNFTHILIFISTHCLQSTRFIDVSKQGWFHHKERIACPVKETESRTGSSYHVLRPKRWITVLQSVPMSQCAVKRLYLNVCQRQKASHELMIFLDYS